jgi:glycerol-3-phosphate acyltransferase PlsY
MGVGLGVGAIVLAFGIGAIPFSNLVARCTRGTDLRDVGSGTVSGTALYRVAGFVPLAGAGVAEVAKGAVVPLLVGSGHPVPAAVAGVAAVIGHNWSPYLRGEGGRGLAPAIGALLVVAWPGAILLLVALTVGALVHATGVVCLIGELALTPVLAVTSGGRGAWIGAAIAAPMLVKRAMGNRSAEPGWRAHAHRLVFDDERNGASS